jgi:hypothetical protein
VKSQYNIKNNEILKTRYEDVGWIHLALDRDQPQALVDTVMDLWVP